ncbi:hypothetical protein HDU67_000743 [Dinochytrium kinnereticum]|nr:hypothetical protein HDU67_000743 [Dinochytrium kinnereticum]
MIVEKFQSRRLIYDAICEGKPIWTHADFDQVINEHGDSWAKGLDWFKPRAITSKPAGEKEAFNKLKPWEKSFCMKLSQYVQLDELQCYQMMISYMRIEEQSSTAVSRKFEVDPNFEDQFLDAVTAHYFEERISTLQLMSALIETYDNPEHVYSEQIHRYISKVVVGASAKEFTRRLMSQFTKIITQKIPSHVESKGSRAILWARQYLLEQKALLNLIFVMHYDLVTCDSTDILHVIRVFNDTRFGLLQANSPLFDDYSNTLAKEVSFLCGLVVVAMLNLEKCLDDSQEDNLPTTSEDASVITSLLALYVSPGFVSHQSTVLGMLLLSWGCLIQQSLNNRLHWIKASADLPRKLVQGASNLKVFQYLENALTSYCQIFSVGETGNSYRSIVKGLLNLFACTFNVGSHTDFQAIALCCAAIFKGSPGLSEQFWLQDYPIAERRSILDAARMRFPIETHSFIALCSSLSNDHTTAGYLFNYLCRMTTFTTPVEMEYLERSADGNYFLRSNIPLLPDLAPASSFSAPLHTEASLVSSNPPIAILKLSFSIFHLMVNLVEGFLRSDASIEKRGFGSSALAFVADIVKLFQSIAEKADKVLLQELISHVGGSQKGSLPTLEHPTDVVNMFCRILNRSCLLAHPPQELIKSCVDIIALFTTLKDDSLWPHIRDLTIIPKFSHRKYQEFSSFPTSNYLQSTLLPFERSLGIYSVTLSFLKLVKAMLNEGNPGGCIGKQVTSVRAEILESCLMFIHSEIFPTFGTWRYQRLLEKFEITLSILHIFNAVLEDCLSLDEQALDVNPIAMQTAFLNPSELSPVRIFLLTSYLTESSLYQLTPLLDVLASSNSGPENLYQSQRVSEGHALEKAIVEALKFTNTLLKWRKTRNLAPSLLEHALLDRTVQISGKQGVTELMNIIGSYVMYPYNFDIPSLAIETLTLLCASASEWKPRPPSFVGYFGTRASTIVSTLIEIASGEEYGKAPGTDETVRARMQSCALNLIRIVIQTQPGLGTLFLHKEEGSLLGNSLAQSSEEVDSPGLWSQSAKTILDVVVEIIDQWKSTVQERCAVLLSSVALLETLWSVAPEHQIALERIRGSDTFWASIESLLSFDATPENDSASSQICSILKIKVSLFRIVAYEIYYKTGRLHKGNSLEKGEASTLLALTARLLEEPSMKRIAKESCLGSVSFHDYGDVNIACRAVFGFTIDKLLSSRWHEIFDVTVSEDCHVYNTEFIRRKLKENPDCSELRFLYDRVRAFNLAHSLAESRLKLTAGLCLFLNAFSHRFSPFITKGLEKNSKTFSRRKALHVVSILFDSLAITSGTSMLHISFFSEMSSSITCLLKFLFSDGAGETSSELDDDLLQAVLRFLTLLLESMRGDALTSVNLTETIAGIMSNFCAGLLLLLGYLLKHSDALTAPKNKAKANQFLQTLFPEICMMLSNLLSKESASLGSSLHLSLVSVLTDALRLSFRMNDEKDIQWLPSFIESKVLILLLKMVADLSPASDEGHSKAEPSLARTPLQLILLIASIPDAADNLIDSGLIAYFSSLSISEDLTNGVLPSRVGGNRPSGHPVWCLMLSTISEALLSGRKPSFIDACIGLIKTYWKQIERCLELCLEEDVSYGGLEELVRITQLSYSLTVAMARSNAVHDEADFLNFFHESCVRLLDSIVFLLNHPATLQQRIVHIEKDRNAMEVAVDNAAGSSGNVDECEMQLFAALRNVVSSICLFSNLEQALIHRSFGIAEYYLPSPVHQSVLLECLSYVSDLMKRVEKPRASEPNGPKTFPSPWNMALVSTQTLAIIAVQSKASSGDRRELTELVQQVITGLGNLKNLGDEGSIVAKQAIQEVRDIERFFVGNIK